MVIVFEPASMGNNTAPFTVIAPMRGLYQTNCSTVISKSDGYCSGVHLVEGNNTGLQSVYLNPYSCQGVRYSQFGLQCTSTADMFNTSSVTTSTVLTEMATTDTPNADGR